MRAAVVAGSVVSGGGRFLGVARAFLRRVRHGRRDTRAYGQKTRWPENPSSGRVLSHHKYLGENVSVRDGKREKNKTINTLRFRRREVSRDRRLFVVAIIILLFFFFKFFFTGPRAGERERGCLP